MFNEKDLKQCIIYTWVRKGGPISRVHPGVRWGGGRFLENRVGTNPLK